jgi:hypothetical protein
MYTTCGATARWPGRTCAAARMCRTPATSTLSPSPRPRRPTGAATSAISNCNASTAPPGRPATI